MVTISALRKALTDKERHFATLKNIKVLSEIRRSTLFAECEAEQNGKRLMLYMPLSSLSLRHIEHFIGQRRCVASSLIPHIEILRDEMLYEDSMGNTARCDIMVETLPTAALPFDDAWATAASDAEYASTLLGSIDALQEALRSANCSHNNLQRANILIDEQDRLYPIRWHYATAVVGGDDEAIEAMRNSLREFSANNLVREGDYAPYDVSSDFEGHLFVGEMSEGLVAVEDSEGWGFVDGENRFVIKPQYLWVNDFREGRAEVETKQGMGLIDKQGRYIIPAEYDIVDYDPRKGHSLVRRGAEWALFDYFGEQICPFGSVEPEI